MSQRARIIRTKRKLARKMAPGTWVGSRFLFIDPNKIDPNKIETDKIEASKRDQDGAAAHSDRTNLIADLVATQLHPNWRSPNADPAVGIDSNRSLDRVAIPLPNDKKIKLPGFAIRADRDPEMRLASLTVDRDLYRALDDTVNVLVVDFARAGQTVTLDLQTASVEVDHREVQIDQHGMGVATFANLPSGNYDVRCRDDADIEPCRFQFAGFDLAPLSATLKKRTLNRNKLSVHLELNRFGRPVDAAVRIDLYDGDDRVDSRPVRVRKGAALATLELEGEGPHHLEIHHKKFADATATVPLPGTEKSQQEATVFSRGGDLYAASLMPADDSVSAFGLHITHAGTTNCPVKITRTSLGKVRLESMVAIEDTCLIWRPCQLANPNNRSQPDEPTSREIHREMTERVGHMVPGQFIELETPEVMGVLSVGGFVDQRPWEHSCVTIGAPAIDPAVRVHGQEEDLGSDAPISPGSIVTIEVNSGATIEGSAWIVVRDARLQPSEVPQQKLAARLKQTIECSHVGDWDLESPYPLFATDEGDVYYHRSPSPPIDEEVMSYLVDQGIITEEQADEVLESSHYLTLYRGLIGREYAEPDEVCRAIAQFHQLEYIELDDLEISDEIIELCPESVARENSLLPIAIADNTLRFAVVNPMDLELIEKMRFIMNRPIEVVMSNPRSIHESINLFYGQVEGESADSMLQEFTDTAIDFTESALFMDGVVMAAGGSAPEHDLQHSEQLQREPEISSDLELLHCSLTPLVDGIASIDLTLPDDPGRFTIDTFIVAGVHWAQADHTFDTDSDPFVKLSVPSTMVQSDHAIGRVVARCKSGNMRLKLTHNGVAVDLYDANLKLVSGESLAGRTEVELTFAAGVGVLVAEVVDLESERSMTTTREIDTLGKRVSVRRTMRLLGKGDSVALDDQIKRIRPLQSTRSVTKMVAEATSDYEHLCCEQTAAKLFASFASLAQASGMPESVGKRQSQSRAISAIRAGLQRQTTMWVPGNGFRFYLGQPPNETWGKMAAQHLLMIDFLADSLAHSPGASDLLQQVKSLASEAGAHYQIAWPPASVGDLHDAYAVLIHSESAHEEVRSMAINMAAKQMHKPANQHRVLWRMQSALAAACLLRCGNESQIAQAVSVANQILDDLTAAGRLYSTCDSVALIVMLNELAHRMLADSKAQVIVNGQSQNLGEVFDQTEPIESISNMDGNLPVELLCWHQEDWSRFDHRAGVSVAMSVAGNFATTFEHSQTIELTIEIDGGYQPGDCFAIALPPCLSRLEGGGQLKQFEVDPQGESKVTITLAATSASSHPAQARTPQHFMVVLRNMFDEDRVGSPGQIAVTVI